MTSDELRNECEASGDQTSRYFLNRAADEIDRLTVRVAELEAEVAGEGHDADSYFDKSRHLESRVAELESDAKRYRWFSENVVLHTPAVRRVLFMIPRTTEEFDAAIDAAIAEEAKQ